MAGLQLGCADAFDNPCPEDNCSAESASNNAQGTATSSGTSSSNTANGSNTNSGPTAISSGNGEGNSTNGENNQNFGFAGGGGTNFNNDYDQHETYTKEFLIIDQLTDKVVETESFFTLQFIVNGTYPLTYQWYRDTGNGFVEIGNNMPYFYEIDTNFTHQGRYYVEVTDGNGKKIKSRLAQIHVIPGRNPCDAEEYAPRYSFDRAGQLDWNFLYEKPYLINRDKYAIQSIKPTSDTGYYTMKCNINFMIGTGVGYCSSFSGLVMYQCQNGKFKLISNTCHCVEDNGGGG
ncbi:MAG: hypothetical protein KDD58_09020 [Bdellovibrionales bacterium]|nr:hypothetical protein [Bdellovibrionales bacterium]